MIDLTETDFLDRETALIKVHTKPEHRDEAVRIAEIFRAKIVDSSPTTYTIEITGDVDKVEAMINMLKPLGIKDLIRTGRIAISRETTRTASPRREPALLKNLDTILETILVRKPRPTNFSFGRGLFAKGNSGYFLSSLILSIVSLVLFSGFFQTFASLVHRLAGLFGCLIDSFAHGCAGFFRRSFAFIRLAASTGGQ